MIDEFDQLYAEGATRRRVMVTSARFWINFQGRYDRLGSRLLAGSLGGVTFEPAPVVRPGVRARNRDEGWVMASRKAREGYELGPR
jgi:hypothetical protein